MNARHLAPLALLTAAASGASAEPMTLSGQELDRVAAGGSVMVQVGEPHAVAVLGDKHAPLLVGDLGTSLEFPDLQALLERLRADPAAGDPPAVGAPDGAAVAVILGPGRAFSLAVAVKRGGGDVAAAAKASSRFVSSSR